MTKVYKFADYRHKKKKLCFTRPELNLLLSLYSSRVIAGDWKAYAIDHHSNMAEFSIFAHARGRPIFVIVKSKQSANAPANFTVVKEGRKLAYSDNLASALRVFQRNLRLVST